MNSEEFEKLCEELRAQYGAVAKKEHPEASEEEIADMCDAAIMNELWDMFLDKKIEKDDLVKMAGQLGFEPTEEFEQGESVTVKGEDSEMTIPNEDGPDVKVSEEEIKEAQGYDEKEDEDSERKEARKLFGFDDEEKDEEEEKDE